MLKYFTVFNTLLSRIDVFLFCDSFTYVNFHIALYQHWFNVSIPRIFWNGIIIHQGCTLTTKYNYIHADKGSSYLLFWWHSERGVINLNHSQICIQSRYPAVTICHRVYVILPIVCHLGCVYTQSDKISVILPSIHVDSDNNQVGMGKLCKCIATFVLQN